MEVLTTMLKTIKKAVIATAAVLTFVLPQSAFAKDNDAKAPLHLSPSLGTMAKSQALISSLSKY